MGHAHVRERRKSSLYSCSCHHHHYKCSNVFEETFLLGGLYVLRVKARLQPTEPHPRQLLLSAKQLSAWPRASSENPWLRANFNGGTGGCNWLSQLHTSPMALRFCLPPRRIVRAPVHRCRLQAVHGQGCSSWSLCSVCRAEAVTGRAFWMGTASACVLQSCRKMPGVSGEGVFPTQTVTKSPLPPPQQAGAGVNGQLYTAN